MTELLNIVMLTAAQHVTEQHIRDVAGKTFNITCVTNREQLITALQQHAPTVTLCVTTDGTNEMVDLNLAVVREHDPLLSVVVITDTLTESAAAAAMAAGVNDCLSQSSLSRLPYVLEREHNAYQARKALAEHEQVLGNAARRIPGYIFQRLQKADGSFRFTYLSDSLEEQFGVDRMQLLQDPAHFWNLIHPDDRAALAQVFAEAHAKVEAYHAEYRAILPDDRVVWVRVRAQPTLLANGDVIWNGLGIDVTAEKSAHEQLNYLAYYDSVTGLPNRHLFLDRLDQAIRQSGRMNTGFALHMLDLDHFKSVNDTYGHMVGDQLLQRVSEYLSSMIRDSDTLARFGGDEFTLIQTGVSHQLAAEHLAGKLIDGLDKTLLVDGHELSAQVSIGIACYGAMFPAPGGHNHQTELIRRADIALYDAKHRGRASYSIYTERLQRV